MPSPETPPSRGLPPAGSAARAGGVPRMHTATLPPGGARRCQADVYHSPSHVSFFFRPGRLNSPSQLRLGVLPSPRPRHPAKPRRDSVTLPSAQPAEDTNTGLDRLWRWHECVAGRCGGDGGCVRGAGLHHLAAPARVPPSPRPPRSPYRAEPPYRGDRVSRVATCSGIGTQTPE